MRMRRLKSHPVFRLEGRSKHFQSFWELELTPGEETSQHQHYESEEAIYLLSGEGQIQVAEERHRIRPGEVVLVPPRTNHLIANRSDHVLQAITVESRFDLGVTEENDMLSSAKIEQTVQVQEEAKRCSRTIDELMNQLPAEVDEAIAIRTIVDLFDIGGRLSEEIEDVAGLDNEEGLAALAEVERKIMFAVVTISGRYELPKRGWRFG